MAFGDAAQQLLRELYLRMAQDRVFEPGQAATADYQRGAPSEPPMKVAERLVEQLFTPMTRDPRLPTALRRRVDHETAPG
jgi:hypothetical protein